MARIIRDTSPFIPASDQPGRPQPDRDKTQRAAGWLGLANAVVSSPITGALIRGGQAIKHGVEDSNYKAAAERSAERYRKRAGNAATEIPPNALKLRDEEPESIFGAGALSRKPEISSLGLRLGADELPSLGDGSELDSDSPPRLGAGWAAGGKLPPLEGEPVAAAPARSVDDDKTVREAEQLARGAIGAVTGAKPPGPGMDAPPQPPEDEFPLGGVEPLIEKALARKWLSGTPETPTPLSGMDGALPAYRAAAMRRAGVATPAVASPVPEEAPPPPIVQPTRLEAARDRSAGIASGLGPLAVLGEDPDFGETPPPAAGLGDLTDKSDAVLRQALDGLGRGSATDPRIAARKYMIQTELQKREQGVADAKMSQDRYRADAPLRADEERQIAADDEVLSQGAPIEREDIWHAARGADTLEKQQKVLQDVARARVPIASFADLISNAGEDRLMQEARSLFPGVRDEENALVKRRIAELKADEIAERTLGYKPKRELIEAQTDFTKEKDTDLERSRPFKEDERVAKTARLQMQADNYEAKTKQIGAEQDARLKLMAAKVAAYGDAAKLSAARLKKLTAVAKGGGGSAGGRSKLEKALEAEIKSYTDLRKANANELEPLEKEQADFRLEEASLEAQMRRAEADANLDPADFVDGKFVPPTMPEKTGDDRADAALLIDRNKRIEAGKKRVREAANAKADGERAAAALKLLRSNRDKKQVELQKQRKASDDEIAPALRQAIEELAKLKKRTLGPTRPPLPSGIPKMEGL